MSSPLYARLASKVLEETETSAHSSPLPGERARAIAAIERQLVGRGRRRRMLRFAYAIGVALAAGGSLHMLRRPGPTALVPTVRSADVAQIVPLPAPGRSIRVAAGSSARLDDGRALVVGSRVVTPSDGHATLSFSTGTSLLLHEGTDMTVAAEGPVHVMRLDVGSVDLHVAKLAADERFMVDTPDSEVEVRGTQFRVSLVPPEPDCGGGARTRVLVTEGVVVVRHAGAEERIGAGGRWPGGCVRSGAPVSTISNRSPATGAAATMGSTLSEENDLFTAAVSAKRRGDLQAALVGFDRFLARYPKSQLVESAVVERMRLIHESDPAHSRAVADDYLARYPNGFAHAEAEAILAAAP